MVTKNTPAESDLYRRVSRRMALAGLPAFELHSPPLCYLRSELWGGFGESDIRVDLLDHGPVAGGYRYEFACVDLGGGGSLGSPSTAPTVAAALDGYDWSTLRRLLDGNREPGLS